MTTEQYEWDSAVEEAITAAEKFSDAENDLRTAFEEMEQLANKIQDEIGGEPGVRLPSCFFKNGCSDSDDFYICTDIDDDADTLLRRAKEWKSLELPVVDDDIPAEVIEAYLSVAGELHEVQNEQSSLRYNLQAAQMDLEKLGHTRCGTCNVHVDANGLRTDGKSCDTTAYRNRCPRRANRTSEALIWAHDHHFTDENGNSRLCHCHGCKFNRSGNTAEEFERHLRTFADLVAAEPSDS